LPFEPSSQTNRGYAFINFKEPAQAWNFKVQFECFHLRHLMPISLEPAAIQGFEENYRCYSKISRAFQDAPEYRPVFLRKADVKQFCPYCGDRVVADAIFCTYCGAQLHT